MRSILKRIIFSSFIFILTSCFDEEEYDYFNSNDLLSFSEHNLSAIADGVNAVSITVTLNPNIQKSKRDVTLKTTLGSFITGKGDSIVFRGEDKFSYTANLVSSRFGDAKVSAKIDGFVIEDAVQITFNKAFPTKILVSVDSFSIKSNFENELLVTASLKSGNGIPSQGHPVVFSSFTSDGEPIGYFLNHVNKTSSDQSGYAKIRFGVEPTIYRGIITIMAETEKDDGTKIYETTKVFLTD